MWVRVAPALLTATDDRVHTVGICFLLELKGEKQTYLKEYIREPSNTHNVK